jgi:L-amino acid N-acyltransferase YncA
MTIPRINLRSAEERDADSIAAIYAPIARDTVISFETEPPRRRSWPSASRRRNNATRGWLRRWAKGVGRRLYGSLLAMLRAQGLHGAFAGIALPNDASVRLHEAVGFRPLGIYREVGFKFGAWRDVGWWRLALADGHTPPAEPVPFPFLCEMPGFGDLLV